MSFISMTVVGEYIINKKVRVYGKEKGASTEPWCSEPMTLTKFKPNLTLDKTALLKLVIVHSVLCLLLAPNKENIASLWLKLHHNVDFPPVLSPNSV